jgi:hypothetical protein
MLFHEIGVLQNDDAVIVFNSQLLHAGLLVAMPRF